MADEIKSKDFAMQAQTKILTKMASKNLSKLLIDEKTNDILDEFYKIIKIKTENKKQAEKFLKTIVKLMIKVSVLQRKEMFSADEIKLVEKFQLLTRTTSMTIVSFYEVDFTFDKYVLSKQINEGRTVLQQLVAYHLSEKSKDKINSVFDVLGDPEFLEDLFEPSGKYRPSLSKIVDRLNQLIEDGVI